MDLHEDAESNTVTATFDLPGMSKEAVNIDIHNSRLTISGENQSSQEKTEKGYTVRERGYGRFSRALPLPPGTKVSDPPITSSVVDLKGIVLILVSVARWYQGKHEGWRPYSHISKNEC